MDKKQLNKAKKRVKAKKEFYQHLATYLTVNAFVFAINWITFSGEWWFYFLILSWGIGLVSHYITVFGFPIIKVLSPDWEEEQLEKEMNALEMEAERQRWLEERSKENILPLDNELEMKEFKKLRKEWDDSEFV